MIKDIKTAKESLTETKEIMMDKIFSEIQEAKKDGELYCKHLTKRTEIDLRQADEIMDYLTTKGYDIYRYIPANDMCLYAYYKIFWDDESSGKYRSEDVKWVKKEEK